MKKVLCMLLCITSLIFNVSCGNMSEENSVYKISVFCDGDLPADDNKIFKIIKDELGYEFDFHIYTGTGEKEKKAMAASGTYTDLITVDTAMIEQEKVIPLDDLIPKYENLYNHYKDYFDSMRYSDGHIYTLPAYGTEGEVKILTNWNFGFFIQKAVLAEFGYPKIKTLDEYFDIIEKYVSKYPEINDKKTIGYTICNDGARNYGLIKPPEMLAGYPDNANCIVDSETHVAYDAKTSGIAKRFYRKLCEENAKGIIDKEACIMSNDQYIEKLSEGNVLGFADQYWNVYVANDMIMKKGQFERTYLSIPLVYDEDIREQYINYSTMSYLSGFMISKDCKDPEAVLELLDTLLEEKWQKLMAWGIEGEDYLVNEEGRYYKSPEIRSKQYETGWNYHNSAETLYNYLPKLSGTFEDGNSVSIANQPEEYYATLNGYDQEFLDAYGMESFGDFYLPALKQPDYFPTYKIAPVGGSAEYTAQVDADRCNNYYLPLLIKCKPEEFKGLWREYCTEYKNTRYDLFIDFLNEEIQKYLK